MKLWGWVLAVALALAVTGIATRPAAAQPDRVRVVEKTTYYESDRKWRGGDRKWDNSERKWRGSDRKWDNSDRKWNNSRSKWGWRTACRNQWHHGRRERACRNVRYRRW